MARQTAMTWNARQRRWFKKYRGHQYCVSPKALDRPATKQDSYLAANEWWRAKRAEIDSLPEPDHGLSKSEIDRLRKSFATEADFEAWLADDRPRRPLRNTFGNPLGITGDELQLIQANRQETDNGLGDVATWIAKFIEVKRAESATKEISLSRYDIYRLQLEYFRDWLGGHNALAIIDAAKMADWLQHLRSLVAEREDKGSKFGCSAWYAKGRLDTSRQFIRYLWELELIDLPRNISSKKFNIKIETPPPESIPLEQVQLILKGNEHTAEKTRLYILLMLNCGFQQSDIADIRQSEVDWKTGRIKRPRNKTKKRKSAQIVEYKLWGETFALLKKYRSDHAERVLINEKGMPLWRQRLQAEGKLITTDNIKSAYNKYIEEIPCKPPMKLYRKTSAACLQSHKEYRQYASLFLAHSPATIKEIHYAPTKSDAGFDAGLAWLGQQYGVK